jgi:hypothetical protein
LKSEVGGKANLQRAITMDSMGRHTEAKSLYQLLKGHRSSEVARTARSMSFGFTAGASSHRLGSFWFQKKPETTKKECVDRGKKRAALNQDKNAASLQSRLNAFVLVW